VDDEQLALRARLGRAIVSFSDLSEARASLARLRELDEFELSPAHRSHDFVAHSTCLVVAYCRPFTRNRDTLNNAPRLPDDYLSEFTEAELGLHKRMKDLRDTEFAHADAGAQGLNFSIASGQAGNLAMPVHRSLRKSLTAEEVTLLDDMIRKILGSLSQDLRELPNQLPVDVGTLPFEDPKRG
jgi:hypothetical protein